MSKGKIYVTNGGQLSAISARELKLKLEARREQVQESPSLHSTYLVAMDQARRINIRLFDWLVQGADINKLKEHEKYYLSAGLTELNDYLNQAYSDSIDPITRQHYAAHLDNVSNIVDTLTRSL